MPVTRGPSISKSTGYLVDEKAIDTLKYIYERGMDPVDLATWVKKGIEDEQLYIIPYPEEREALEKHFKMIVESVLPMEADPEGAKKAGGSVQGHRGAGRGGGQERPGRSVQRGVRQGESGSGVGQAHHAAPAPCGRIGRRLRGARAVALSPARPASAGSPG